MERFGEIDAYFDGRTALLDFDTGGRAPRLGPVWAVLRILGLAPAWTCYRRTRKGWHLLVRLGSRIQLAPAELVALQILLGSDSRREALNLMRVLSLSKVTPKFWRKRWNLLYARKPI